MGYGRQSQGLGSCPLRFAVLKVPKLNLTERQEQILTLIQSGETQAAIGSALRISRSAVAGHVSELRRKGALPQ